MSRKRVKAYRANREAWRRHDRRVELGLLEVAARVPNLHEFELDAVVAEVQERGAVAELSAMAAEIERSEAVTADALVEENPSEAAAARARASTWRRLATRLGSRRSSRGRARKTAGEPAALRSSTCRVSESVKLDAAEAAAPPPPQDVDAVPPWRELTAEIRALRAEIEALRTERGCPPEKQGDALHDELREIREALGAIEGRVSELREELHNGIASRVQPLVLPPDEACEAVKISRPTFDRWLADPGTGLRSVVHQPGGPGTKVIVPMDDFRAWMRKRTSGTSRARRRA